MSLGGSRTICLGGLGGLGSLRYISGLCGSDDGEEVGRAIE